MRTTTTTSTATTERSDWARDPIVESRPGETVQNVLTALQSRLLEQSE